MPLFGPPGERISYTVYDGPEGAPLLVLVHGFTASAASFDANIQGLRKRFTVVTAELLGHGDSDAPADPDAYGPRKAVVRLLRLFSELGYGRVLLCGHSLGAALALRLALEAPESLSGLILINSNSAAGTPEWREQVRPRMAELASRVRAEGTGFLRDTRLYPAQSKHLDEHSRELLVQSFDRLTPEGVAGTAEALTVDVNAFEHVPELRVPTLVVLGDRDADFVRTAPGLLAQMPAGIARLVQLHGAGHAANIEQPEAFEAAVIGFATEVGVLDPLPAPRAATRGETRYLALSGAGAVLVLGGLALLVGAFFFHGSNSDNSQIAAAAPGPSVTTSGAATSAEATPTPVQLVLGTRSAGPALLTATAAAQPAATNSPSVQPPATKTSTTAAATAQATSTPARTATRAATSTPAPTAVDTPTPAPTAVAPTDTPAPEPTATASPSGPRASISSRDGTHASPGGTLTFTDASSPTNDVQQESWSVSSGATIVDGTNTAAIVVSFPEKGCYTVSLTVTFRNHPGTMTASQVVTTGEGLSCSGG